MENTEEGLVFDLPPLTTPNSINSDTAPWVIGAVSLLLIVALRYKIWRGWKRRLSLFRNTEKPLLKFIGWLEASVSTL